MGNPLTLYWSHDQSLLEDWTAPYGAPPLDRITPEHFPPAYDRALAEHVAEIAAIAENPAAAQLRECGGGAGKERPAADAGGRVCSTISPPPRPAKRCRRSSWKWRRACRRIGAPSPCIRCCSRGWMRFIASVTALGLDAESLRVLERYHLDFVRAGAQLKGEDRDRLAAIAERLAVLGTQFSQNVLGDEEDWILSLNESQMAGIPPAVRDAAAAKAAALKLDAPFAVTLSRSSVEPFLQYADDRALREQLYRAWVSRGDNDNAHNNTAIITEMLSSAGRARQAAGL